MGETKRTVDLFFPYAEQGKVSSLYGVCQVLDVAYEEEFVRIRVRMDRALLGRYAAYRR